MSETKMHTWEQVYASDDSIMWRFRVPSGWLYMYRSGKGMALINMGFVPEPTTIGPAIELQESEPAKE